MNAVKGFQVGAFLKNYNVMIIFVALFTFASISYEHFFTTLNIFNVLKQASILGLLAIGMTFVIITRGIDISVGSVLALSGVLAANLSKYGVLVAIVVPLAVSCLIGIVNGLVVTKVRMDPFVATLATMIGIRGIAFIATGEVAVRIEGVSESFYFLGRGDVLGIPLPIYIMIILFVVMSFVARYRPFGRHVYAVGGNEEAAKMMGLPVDRIKIKVYVLSSLLAGIAGIILASRLGAGHPVVGDDYHLQAIATVVLGGTLLTGGVGKLSGTFFGVLIMSLITNIFNMQGNISTWWQNVLMGVIVLLVIVSQAAMNREGRGVRGWKGRFRRLQQSGV